MKKILLTIAMTLSSLYAKEDKTFCLTKDLSTIPTDKSDMAKKKSDNEGSVIGTPEFQKKIQKIINETNPITSLIQLGTFNELFNNQLLESVYDIFKNRKIIERKLDTEEKEIKNNIRNAGFFEKSSYESEYEDFKEKREVYIHIITILKKVFKDGDASFIVTTYSEGEQPEFAIKHTNYVYQNLDISKRKELLKLLTLLEKDYSVFGVYQISYYDLFVFYGLKWLEVGKQKTNELYSSLFPNKIVLEKIKIDLKEI